MTKEDLALPPAYQEGMIALQNQREGVDMTVYECPAGHSPHLTWTEGMVAKLQEFAQKALA